MTSAGVIIFANCSLTPTIRSMVTHGASWNPTKRSGSPDSRILAVLQLVGLFDRPASADGPNALRAKPAIRGLTDAIVGLNDDQWRRSRRALARGARWCRSTLPTRKVLDAHPLVRERFGDRLRQTSEVAKPRTVRLFDHLRRTAHEGNSPTLADLAPLYHSDRTTCLRRAAPGGAGKGHRNSHLPRRPDGTDRILCGTQVGRRRESRRSPGSSTGLMTRPPR